MKEQSILVFGGTFNPPHLGHANLLEAFRREMNFDKVLILPSAFPPHKEESEHISGEIRAKMCALAFPDCEICDYEIKRGGKNYTADTLEYLKSIYPESKLYFLMGTDMLLSFNQWRDPERIVKNAVLLCACRDGKTKAKELENFALNELGLTKEQFIISEKEPFEMSSSKIRQAVKNKEDISGYVCPEVAEFIRTEGLYG